MIAELPLWKDYTFELDVESPDETTGLPAPTTGLAPTVWIETALGAGAVDPSLSLTLTERSAVPGRYAVVFDQPALTQHLAAFDARRVWICVRQVGDIDVERFARVVRAVSQG